MSKSAPVVVTAFFAVIFLPDIAEAYVGPGAGLSALGSLLSLLAAIGLGIVGFVWYPVRRLLRRFQAKKPQAGKAVE